MFIINFLFWALLSLWFFGVRFQYMNVLLGILAGIIALSMVL